MATFQLWVSLSTRFSDTYTDLVKKHNTAPELNADP